MTRIHLILVVVGQALLLVIAMVALHAGWLPRGVPGEWEWARLPEGAAVSILDLGLAGIGILLYAGFVAVGMKSLGQRAGKQRETLWLIGLGLCAIGVQFTVMAGAPYGYGLTKWAFALYQPGSSGYYTVARKQITNLPDFLSAYPDWIKTQDALHIGTHPPGLFVTSAIALKTMESHPELAKSVVTSLPESVAGGFRELSRKDPLPAADQASMALTGLAILMLCALTVVPLYILGRSTLPPATAWGAASLWPLVPSAILFQPAADTAFPFLATIAIALAARSGTRGSLILAGVAGAVLGLGLFFTLAYLPVGLVVAVILFGQEGWRNRIASIAATGVGFVGFTLLSGLLMKANPLAIWWTNQANHARFYVEYPKSYLAWVVANPIETAIGIGLPSTLLGIVGWATARTSISRSTWAAFGVLMLLNFSGRNLSEVARLWLPLFPPLLLASGAGVVRLGGPWMLFCTVGLVGLETLILQTLIQVVYPF